MNLLRQLPEHGFAPDGFDAMQAVEVGVGGAPFALFAFAAAVPFQVSVDDSDVSPGYGERVPARTITLRMAGRMPVKVWTAILMLAGEGMRSLESE
jgi:hypothetical protein